MKNSILSTLLILLASFYMSGCSLFSSDSEETETATVAEEGEASSTEGAESSDEYAYDDFEDGDESVSEGGSEGSDSDLGFDSDEGFTQENLQVGAADSATDVVAEDNFSNDTDVDEYPDDDYQEGSAYADVGTDSYSQDSVFVDEGGGEIPADAMSSNQEQDLFAKDEGPVVDEPSYADATDYNEPIVDSSRWVPVKKMKSETFKRAGINVNRLYIVRPGDNMSSVAEKVSANKQDLYNINPHFNGKSLQVGDKVYYGSSRSPNDSTMKTYYEDMNISPQYYSSQSGDNIRKVSQQLLGHQRSWMEVWATNPNVESKDTLSSDMQLRYWPDGADTQMAKAEPVDEPAQEVAAAPVEEPIAEETPAAEVPVEESMGDVQDVAQIEDPGNMNEEMPEISEDEEFNPPPAAGTMGGPPPPPKAVAPPPPPPAPMAKNNLSNSTDTPLSFKGAKDTLAAAQDDQMIMIALGSLLILAAIIMLVFIRRSRSKRVNFSQTQV